MAEEQNANNPKSEADEFKEKLVAAEKQRDEYLAGWQRAKADFVNYRKDELKHLEEVAKYGNEDLIKDLITVLDNFDLGLRALEKAGPVEKGVYLIRSQIEDILKKRGLEKIDLKPGDAFDPAVAEALSEVESDKPPGTIVQEIETGYRLHDKVLRPARVIVAKSK
jgi:molecular chaperone GrpE